MMDVAGTFATGLTVNGVKITNEGTPEHPLFRTKHIGCLLGLSNIRESIKDFDEDEKLTKQIATTSRGLQTVSFLTEVGLIRLRHCVFPKTICERISKTNRNAHKMQDTDL